MSHAVRAGMAYFVGMFGLGFVLGTVRVMLVVPRLGEWGATLAELPLMLAVSWFYCRWLVAAFAVPAAVLDRLAMGMVAFALLMLAEIMLGIAVFDRTLAGQVREMTSGPGLAGLIGQIAFAAFPLVQSAAAADSKHKETSS